MPADHQSAYAGQRVAVLGASGFIGRRVAVALARQGAELYLLARVAQAAEALAGEFGGDPSVLRCDVAIPGELERAIEKVRPAILFNLAGYGVDPAERDEGLAALVNTELPPRLAAGMAEWRDAGWRGQAVVHVGSALEYGRAAGDLREDTPPFPNTLYGRSKLEGTLGLASASAHLGLPAVTARLFTVYGPGEHEGRLLPTLLRAAAASPPHPIELTAGLQRRDFTFVDDVAEGLLRLGVVRGAPGDPALGPGEPACALGEVVNLATGVLTPVRAFTERAAAVLGIDPARLRFGALPARPEEMAHEPVAIERLRALTGWTPAISSEEGVRRTVEALLPRPALPRP